MTNFLQLHVLVAYPPSNLNRDDTGRPKSAMMGGVPRLRISSQALKRAWRTSSVFADHLQGHLGVRTKRLGAEIRERLAAAGTPDEKALAVPRAVAGVLGKIKSEKDAAPDEIEQLAFLSTEERQAAFDLAERAVADETIKPAVGDLLQHRHTAADIAMFGRMLAASPEFNVEAAVQVGHALTTHRVIAEDDYFTAVDDLKTVDDDRGAGHVGEAEFGSGVFYIYLCVDLDLLAANLGGDRALAEVAVAALIEAAATVAPRGKQASFASRARASYILAERGSQQPRSLASAFLRPVAGEDLMGASIAALEKLYVDFDRAYGPGADARCTMNVPGGIGTLKDLITFSAASKAPVLPAE